MKIRRILLDLDDVLVDFSGAACYLHARTEQEMCRDFGDWWTGERFWDAIERIGPSFWENLKLHPWCDKLILMAQQYAPEWRIVTAPCCMRTRPTLMHDIFLGKLRWFAQVFGPEFEGFHITPHKEELAAPGIVLIDDRERNIERFRKEGGHGIIFPRSLNSKAAYLSDPLTYVKEELELLCT